MDAELIVELRKAEMDCAGSPIEEGIPICRIMGDAATQGTADNARIAELEAKLATAERDALERAAVIAEGERLTDPQAGTSDHAYEQAITDVVTAIHAANLERLPALIRAAKE